MRRASEIDGYVTKDLSLIKEIYHPVNSDVKNQSLALAIVDKETSFHHHKKTEEIYFIVEGKGMMFLDDRKFEVNKGDSVMIKPNQNHKIKNLGEEKLKVLCCCCPAYIHGDTFLVESGDKR